MKKVIIAGGTGFIGKSLSKYLINFFDEVVILTRQKVINNKTMNVKYVYWDGITIDSWVNEIENAEAVINMSGKSIDCRFTKSNKEEILNSRVTSTRALGKAISILKKPPKVWINFSAIGIYGETGNDSVNEYSEIIGGDFMSEVCNEWEKAFNSFDIPGVRKVCLRLSVVLDRNCALIENLFPLVLLGLGGKSGSGKQYMSWIHLNDLMKIVEWLIRNETASGIYNAVAPNPVTNENFMRSFRKKTNSKFGLPAPEWMIKLITFIIGKESSLILNNVNVVSKRLPEQGFNFEYDDIDSCLTKIFS